MFLDRAELSQSCHLERDLGGDTGGTQTHRLLDLLVFTAWLAGRAYHGESCQQLNPEPVKAASNCRVGEDRVHLPRTSGGEL